MHHPKRLVTAAALAAGLGLAPGCGDSTTGPEEVRGAEGAWALTFRAVALRRCPRGQEMPLGCEGAGQVNLRVFGSSLAIASATGRGACQTCSNAIDFTLASLAVSVEDGRLQLRVGPSCVLAADLPADGATSFSGEAVCATGDGGAEARGEWQMVRITR